jgi:FtsP/CotA-like multicopper oxidase with cupredoxin domain
MLLRRPRSRRMRAALPLLAALAVVLPLGWMWASSFAPSIYSATDTGYVDDGGASLPGGHEGHGGNGADRGTGGVPVASLTGDVGGPADVAVTLVARQERFRLASGEEVDGYTLNGTSPGPTLHVPQDRLLEVRLVNESVPGGTTVHWHGVAVPNADDGVAGVTQDAVPLGGSHTYRFRPDRAGTFWYHAHQLSHDQVERGLLGALVVDPPAAPVTSGVEAPPSGPVTDVVALTHLYAGRRTVAGRTGDVPVDAVPEVPVRVRVVNTDNGPVRVWVDGGPFRVLAVDGNDLHEPGPLSGTSVDVTAGGRADLEVVPPAGGALRVEIGGSSALLVGPAGAPAPAPARQPSAALDLLRYGTPAPLGFDPGAAVRTFEYAVGRRPGFVDGRPGLWWTVNGHLFPDLPMFTVVQGDVVRMRVSNSSGEVHPMHLHGHRIVVLARNGEPAVGSPWWVDSLNVGDGESYDVAFVADNPGIWSDHCHNLKHAEDGLIVHLMYAGVTPSYRIGGDNAPE